MTAIALFADPIYEEVHEIHEMPVHGDQEPTAVNVQDDLLQPQ